MTRHYGWFLAFKKNIKISLANKINRIPFPFSLSLFVIYIDTKYLHTGALYNIFIQNNQLASSTFQYIYISQKLKQCNSNDKKSINFRQNPKSFVYKLRNIIYYSIEKDLIKNNRKSIFFVLLCAGVVLVLMFLVNCRTSCWITTLF